MSEKGKNVAAKLLQRILQPFYQKLADKLKKDLQVPEQQRLLHHLIGEIHQLSSQQVILTNQIKTVNLIMSGIYNAEETETSAFWSTSAIYDIFTILQNQPHSSVSIFNYFEEIAQTALQDKSVILIGAGDPLYSQIAKKQGAKSVVRIEMNPFVADKQKTDHESHSEKIIFVYPTNVAALAYPLVDLLFVPRPVVASFLIKHHLFNLGARVKEKAFITVKVKTNSVFSTEKKPPFWQEENQLLTVFNDNYIRQQLHKAGFFEVKCIYSKGIDMSNQQYDQKITHLSYRDDYKIVKNNKSKDQKIFGDNHISTKTYAASKLPEFTLKTS